MAEIRFNRYSDNATIPLRVTVGSAGYDLFPIMDKLIKQSEAELIRTDLNLAIPTGHYGKIAERSGLALKIIVAHNGTIDSDFRGVVCVILTNNSKSYYQVKKGDRIAQIIFEKCQGFVNVLRLNLKI